MKRKTLWLTVALLCLSATISAQTVQFSYDASGNRISRDIVLAKSGDVTSADSTDKELQEQYYVDLFSDVKVTISPNPNGGKFTISISSESGEMPKEKNPVKLMLFSLRGDVIYELNQFEAVNQLDISHQPNGTYFLIIVAGNERKSWKIVKQ